MIKPEDLLRELLQTFQVEAAEHIQTLNMALLALEVRPEEPKRRELLQEAFRAAHSLKGAARAVSLDQIEVLSHGMENILDEARNKNLHLEAGAYDVLYDVLDAIGALLEGKNVEVESLLNRMTPDSTPSNQGAIALAESAIVDSPAELMHVEIESIIDPIPEPPPVVDAAVPTPQNVPPPAAAEPATHEESASLPRAISSEETIRVAISKLDNLMAQVGELLVSRMNAEQRVTDMQSIRRQFTGWPKAWREIKTLLPEIPGEAGKRLAEILNRYQEQFEATTQEVTRFDQRLRQDTLRLGIIASQLQDNVRHVRMVPFETLVSSLQRTVRDAAHSEGKQVTFQVTGGDVELDKKVLETLKDPFIHLLRNAVGHGIEKPEVRSKLGKSAEGHVTLSLQQRGAEVRITMRDDGAGFDLNALRHAGNDKQGHHLDEHASQSDIIEMAFMPGVTTSKQVTALSGRGVGLDVVRQQLEALQGRIEVESVSGKGTSIHLVVPITLTISRGLLVQVGDERYVLPMLSVVKIIEPSRTFSIEGQTMLTVDETTTLPLVSLANLLERPVVNSNGQNHSLAVIMAVAEQRLALLVDDVLTEQELAVKPLGKPLHHVRNVAGTALMGDGKPVVILNAADLVRAAKGARRHTVIQASETSEEQKTARILVVDDSITTRTLEKNILETAGYEVSTAMDGEQALLRLKEQHIDLVVSDVEMPNMNGITLTHRLRETTDFRELPIILVTSLESREDRERGMMAGANAYIVKRGFDQAELLKTVQQLVFVED